MGSAKQVSLLLLSKRIIYQTILTLRVKLKNLFITCDFGCMKVEIKVADIRSEELFVRLILNREAVFDFLDFLKVRSQELTTFALDKGLGSFFNERSDQWILDNKLDIALIVDFAENCNH